MNTVQAHSCNFTQEHMYRHTYSLLTVCANPCRPLAHQMLPPLPAPHTRKAERPIIYSVIPNIPLHVSAISADLQTVPSSMCTSAPCYRLHSRTFLHRSDVSSNTLQGEQRQLRLRGSTETK